MDDDMKVRHGLLLKAAISRKGFDRAGIAKATQVNVRTVTNWTTGTTLPSPREREILREVLGDYDDEGDPVESAIRRSELIDWRQDAVLSTYKRNLHEQRGEQVG